MNTEERARKKLFIFLLFVIPILFLVYMYRDELPFFARVVDDEGPVVRIGNVPIRVEVADTEALREQGLSGRTSLGHVNGMLFIFDRSDYHQIWMKNMYLVIDVIWIDDQFKVIDITRSLRPDSFPKTFEPSSPARFVIETNEHYAESFGIKIGDTVTVPPELIPIDLRPPKDAVPQ